MNDLRCIVEHTLVPHAAFAEANARIEQCIRYAVNSSEPIFLAIVGESRTGKSRLLEEHCSRYPTTRTKEGSIVPILSIKTPSKPTVKGMVGLMLEEMGDQRFDFGTENAKTIRLKTLMRNAGTIMIVLDEFQHFHDKGLHAVMHHMADWLKILADDTKAAVAVSGLESCLAVLEQNEQLAGRFLAPVVMPRFDWANTDHRAEFVAILATFYRSIALHFDMPNIGEEEMAFRCYCATGGLIGYLSKFLRQAVWNAIDSNKKKITLSDLRTAHQASVWNREGTLGSLSPFSNRFEVAFSDELLAKAREIGQLSSSIIVPRSKKLGPTITRSKNF